jgi:hypothetical protein
MSHNRRGRAVNTQMPSDRTLSVHSSNPGDAENYDRAPFSAHPHDVGNGGIPVKIFGRFGERLPADHTPGQTSARGARGTPSPRQRRFGKAR